MQEDGELPATVTEARDTEQGGLWCSHQFLAASDALAALLKQPALPCPRRERSLRSGASLTISTTLPLRQWSQSIQRRISSMTDDSRVAARVVRIAEGKACHRCVVGGVSYLSAEAVTAGFETRHPSYAHD